MTIPLENKQNEFLNKLDSMSSYDILLGLNKNIWVTWKKDLARVVLEKREKQDKLNISKEANEISREANEISKKANAKSNYSVWIAIFALVVSVISLLHDLLK